MWKKCQHEWVSLEELGCMPYEIWLDSSEWDNWVGCKKCRLIIRKERLTLLFYWFVARLNEIASWWKMKV